MTSEASLNEGQQKLRQMLEDFNFQTAVAVIFGAVRRPTSRNPSISELETVVVGELGMECGHKDLTQRFSSMCITVSNSVNICICIYIYIYIHK